MKMSHRVKGHTVRSSLWFVLIPLLVVKTDLKHSEMGNVHIVKQYCLVCSVAASGFLICES
jgi:hypothetical protein